MRNAGAQSSSVEMCVEGGVVREVTELSYNLSSASATDKILPASNLAKVLSAVDALVMMTDRGSNSIISLPPDFDLIKI